MSGTEDPKVFVLKRELSEVHLLLDNISANPDIRLPATQAEVPAMLGSDWLKKICEIDWPPHTGDDKAAEACLLIRTKDFLNTLAKPASGSTIAFTILVTQKYKAGKPDNAAPSRADLAFAAYPDLLVRARSFRLFIQVLSWFLVLWLLATCYLSWTVAYGNLSIQQLSAAQTAYEKAAAQVEGTEIIKSDNGVAPAGTVASPQAAASIFLRTPRILCDQAEKAAATGALNPFVSVTQMQSCEMLDQTETALRNALTTMPRWLDVSPVARVAPPDASYLGVGLNRLSVLGTGVLPFFFGVLGAGAAIAVSLMRKMKSNALSPRDMNLSWQQLALGAVTGACIGLFFAQPGTTGGSEAALAPVGLSASALSFIAGFGVDAVFRTIEGLIQRIFNLPPPVAAVPPVVIAAPAPIVPAPAPPSFIPPRFRRLWALGTR